MPVTVENYNSKASEPAHLPSISDASSLIRVCQSFPEASLPQGWEILGEYSSQTTAYCGMAFLKQFHSAAPFVVVCHKTSFVNSSHMTDEYAESIRHGLLQSEYKEAVSFSEEMYKKGSATYKNSLRKVQLGIGFSAAHATVCAAQLQLGPDKDPIYVFLFESPGLTPMIVDFVADGILPSNSLDYLEAHNFQLNSEVNFLNTVGEHLKSGTYTPLPVPLVPYAGDYFPYPFSHKEKLLLFFMMSWDQHNPDRVSSYWQRRQQVDEQKNQPFVWPNNLKEAYVYWNSYTSESSDAQRNYWNDYIHQYWDKNENLLQPTFKDEQTFKTNFIDTYLNKESPEQVDEFTGWLASYNKQQSPSCCCFSFFNRGDNVRLAAAEQTFSSKEADVVVSQPIGFKQQ